MKYFLRFLLLVCVVVAVGVLSFKALHVDSIKDKNVLKDIRAQSTVISIGQKEVRAFIADTPESQEQGLSGQIGLGADEVMLFVFNKSDYYSFWMKDMNFALDMLWVGVDGKIVTAIEDVKPETFPHTFTSTSPARFVVEARAGFFKENHLKIGDLVSFPKE